MEFKIIDANGTLYSGNEDEMRNQFRIITESMKVCKDCGCRDTIEIEIEAEHCPNCGSLTIEEISNPENIGWDGDLELVEVHSICK